MLKIIKVKGDSLSPEYLEGDFVVLLKFFTWRFWRNFFFLNPLKRGDVLVFHQDEYGIMIKKFERSEQNGERLFVTGTHPHSVDSSQFGPIQRDALIGKVIWHIPKPRS